MKIGDVILLTDKWTRFSKRHRLIVTNTSPFQQTVEYLLDNEVLVRKKPIPRFCESAFSNDIAVKMRNSSKAVTVIIERKEKAH